MLVFIADPLSELLSELLSENGSPGIVRMGEGAAGTAPGRVPSGEALVGAWAARPGA
ncbi:hypothetical protein [Azospirillum thermophilum]|uniref:hypothetical protein n=1 Tax=Azospirillum thermophilum TaxID=2202148 RepID=UPI001FE9B6E2|nr:hypothetical protein [Azospirillum thermophilum]